MSLSVHDIRRQVGFVSCCYCSNARSRDSTRLFLPSSGGNEFGVDVEVSKTTWHVLGLPDERGSAENTDGGGEGCVISKK